MELEIWFNKGEKIYCITYNEEFGVTLYPMPIHWVPKNMEMGTILLDGKKLNCEKASKEVMDFIETKLMPGVLEIEEDYEEFEGVYESAQKYYQEFRNKQNIINQTIPKDETINVLEPKSIEKRHQND